MGEELPKVWFSPAECVADCDDPNCPYIHGQGWKCEGIEGLFVTEAQALAALAVISKQQKSEA